MFLCRLLDLDCVTLKNNHSNALPASWCRLGLHHQLWFTDDIQGHCSGWLNWRRSCNFVSRHRRMVRCQMFTAQRRQDRATVVWSGVAAASSHNNSTNVNQCVVKPLTVVRDLGVWFDVELSMRLHVSRVAHVFTICAVTVTFTSYSSCPVASGLLQRCAGRSSIFHAASHRSSESCTQRAARSVCISSRVTVWLQLFESCTGFQSVRESTIQAVLAGSQVVTLLYQNDLTANFLTVLFPLLHHPLGIASRHTFAPHPHTPFS